MQHALGVLDVLINVVLESHQLCPLYCWLINVYTNLNPYILLLFCKQLRYAFVHMVTCGKVDMSKKIITKPAVAVKPPTAVK